MTNNTNAGWRLYPKKGFQGKAKSIRPGQSMRVSKVYSARAEEWDISRSNIIWTGDILNVKRIIKNWICLMICLKSL